MLGAAVVGLLIFSLTGNRSRIDRLEDTVDAGFAAQDAKIDAKFAMIDARIAKIDARIDTLDLKLTALIAALNKTGEVDAAVEGRLLDPGASDAVP